ncbi:Alpha/Beta hydrolase protein [Lyophyllum atratum]|nr:Alpha/Beta hydrolase protein [Lyophyllum atratum]
MMCQDVVDILDAEKVDKVIAIGHDWGSTLVSRLANYHADRFLAFAFLALSYVPPSYAKFEETAAQLAKLVEYEVLGYWNFFAEKDAHKSIEKNFDSFYNLLLAEDPSLWISHVAPTGASKAWIEADRRTNMASYITEEEVKIQKEHLMKGGMEGPLCWYKSNVIGVDSEDVKAISPEKLVIQQPVFFGAALKDPLCVAAMGKGISAQTSKGTLTVKDFDTGHWLMWEEKDKLNQELLEWVQGL